MKKALALVLALVLALSMAVSAFAFVDPVFLEKDEEDEEVADPNEAAAELSSKEEE